MENYEIKLLEWRNENISKKLIIPPKRKNHCSFIYNDYLFILGGKIISLYSQNWTTIYILNLKNDNFKWYRILTNSKNILKIRNSFGYYIIKDDLYIYGGKLDNDIVVNELLKFNLIEKKEWNLIDTINEGPFKHSFFSFSLNERYLFIYGGNNLNIDDNIININFYDIVENKWNKIEINKSNNDKFPINRESHAGVTFNNKFYFFGGKDINENFWNDLWEIHINKNLEINFEKLNYTGTVRKLINHTCNMINNFILIIGGYYKLENQDLINNMIYLYNFENNCIINLNIHSKINFDGVTTHTSVVNDNFIYIFGGLNQNNETIKKNYILKLFSQNKSNPLYEELDKNIEKELKLNSKNNLSENYDKKVLCIKNINTNTDNKLKSNRNNCLRKKSINLYKQSIKSTNEQYKDIINDLINFLDYVNKFINEIYEDNLSWRILINLFINCLDIKLFINEASSYIEINNYTEDVNNLLFDFNLGSKSFYLYTTLIKIATNIIITYKNKNDFNIIYIEYVKKYNKYKIIYNNEFLFKKLFVNEENYNKFKDNVLKNNCLYIHFLKLRKNEMYNNEIEDFNNYEQKIKNYFKIFNLDFKPSLYINNELINTKRIEILNLIEVNNNDYIKSYSLEPEILDENLFYIYYENKLITKLNINNIKGIIILKYVGLNIFNNKIQRVDEFEILKYMKTVLLT